MAISRRMGIYRNSMKKLLTPGRVMYAFAFLVLCIATAMNLMTKIPFISVIPYTKYVEAVINGFCAVLALHLVIRPDNLRLTCVIFLVESGLTTLIGFVGIGTLLFSALIITLFINGFFIRGRRLKIILLAVYWTIITVGLYPAFGFRPFIFEIALTFFYFAFFAFVYDKLKAKLSYLLPANDLSAPAVPLPPRGSELDLSSYGLSGRQIAFIHNCLEKDETYDGLAELYNVSTSVVKKDMAAACRAFGVKNREALRILLLQYKVK